MSPAEAVMVYGTACRVLLKLSDIFLMLCRPMTVSLVPISDAKGGWFFCLPASVPIVNWAQRSQPALSVSLI